MAFGVAEQRPAIFFLTGANGQIGWELRRVLARLGTVVAHDRSTLDLADGEAIRRAVAAAAPTVIVNAAAYTAVDRAEAEPELAHRINAAAPASLALAAQRSGALLIHYSTDYVFDGTASVPYREADVAHPLNAYGRSKYAGDMAVLDSGTAAYLFRVAWVYGNRGRNFLTTIRQLMADGKPLRIVGDQHGAPTWCRSIAEATGAAIEGILRARAGGAHVPAPGLYHMAPADTTTWAGFAKAIVAATSPVGEPPVVTSISTDAYPTPARRPHWSVLDSTRLHAAFGLRMAPWQDQLSECLNSPSTNTPAATLPRSML